MEFLREYTGPLPNWVWIAAIVLGITGYFLWQRFKGNSSADSASSNAGTSQAANDPNIDPNTGVPYNIESQIDPKTGLPAYYSNPGNTNLGTSTTPTTTGVPVTTPPPADYSAQYNALNAEYGQLMSAYKQDQTKYLTDAAKENARIWKLEHPGGGTSAPRPQGSPALTSGNSRFRSNQ